MEKLKSLLSHPEFHILFFCVSLLLFSYPLLRMSDMAGPVVMLLSLFLPWGGVILILFLVSKSYATQKVDQHADQEEGGRIDV